MANEDWTNAERQKRHRERRKAALEAVKANETKQSEALLAVSKAALRGLKNGRSVTEAVIAALISFKRSGPELDAELYELLVQIEALHKAKKTVGKSE